jgi:hypothetical protein
MEWKKVRQGRDGAGRVSTVKRITIHKVNTAISDAAAKALGVKAGDRVTAFVGADGLVGIVADPEGYKLSGYSTLIFACRNFGFKGSGIAELGTIEGKPALIARVTPIEAPHEDKE